MSWALEFVPALQSYANVRMLPAREQPVTYNDRLDPIVIWNPGQFAEICTKDEITKYVFFHTGCPK